MTHTSIRLTPLGKVVVPAFVLIALGMAAWLLSTVVWPMALFLGQNFAVWKGPAGKIGVGVTIAAILAVIRGSSLRAYGVIEIAFALAALAATAVLTEDHDVVPAMIGYMSSVYVLVRGATNIWETLSQRRRAEIRALLYNNE